MNEISREKVLEKHLKDMSVWLEEEGINKNSNLGKELLKQTKELIEQYYEIRELKEKYMKKISINDIS